MSTPLPGFHLLRSKHDELAKTIATLAFKNSKCKQLAEEDGTHFEDHPLVVALNRAEWDELLIYAYDRYHRELDLRLLGDHIIFLMEVADLIEWATENFDESRVVLLEALKKERAKRAAASQPMKNEKGFAGKAQEFLARFLPFVRV